MFGKTLYDFSEVNSENTTIWTNSELLSDILNIRVFSVKVWESTAVNQSGEANKLLFQMNIDLRNLSFVGSEVSLFHDFLNTEKAKKSK